MMPKTRASFGSEISDTAPMLWCIALLLCTNPPGADRGAGKFVRRTAPTPAAAVIHHTQFNRKEKPEKDPSAELEPLQRTYDP